VSVRVTSSKEDAMPHVDLAFRVMGTKLPVDHGYALYAAINRLVPALHDARDLGVHPVRGRYVGDGNLQLTPSSRLVIRLPDDGIRPFLKLAGKILEVDGHRLRAGVPETRALRPVANLYSRLVTIKGFMEPDAFLEAARRQLQKMEITTDLHLGERRTLRVKDKQVVGFEVTALGLDAEDSIRLQDMGIGGRRRMGCAIFVPFRR
jgi:CRISPR-associated protein Cas6